MKMNINKPILTFFTLLIISVSISAQSESTANTIEEKCELCTNFKTASDMDSYGKNNCRIFQALCDFNSSANTIFINTDETMLNNSEKAINVTGGTATNLVFYIEGSDETFYNIEPKISFVNEAGNEITGSDAKLFQQYTFNQNNELRAVRGVQKIKSISSNDNLVMTTKINLPESNGQKMFLKVDLVVTNPLTNVSQSMKTYYKQIRL